MCFSAHVFTLEDDNSVTDVQKEFLDGNVRAVLNAASGYAAYRQATWSNLMQAYVEASGNKIPVNFSSDPRNGKNCTDWPGNLALAATFDPAVAKQTGAGIAREMREMGVTTFLGPQVDVATDPRWQRFSGTFGEDPALSRDMTRALVDGLQSTVDEKGEDQGWGTGSLVSMVKHWPAEGPGEGGREAHTEGGKYAVYPSDGFEACMIPFVDGAFKLDGKTGSAAAIMTSYTIAYDEGHEVRRARGLGLLQVQGPGAPAREVRLCRLRLHRLGRPERRPARRRQVLPLLGRRGRRLDARQARLQGRLGRRRPDGRLQRPHPAGLRLRGHEGRARRGEGHRELPRLRKAPAAGLLQHGHLRGPLRRPRRGQVRH